MKKSTFVLILFLVISITNTALSQSERVIIKIKNPKDTNYIKADDFYLTHHLYIDFFLRDNLFPDASPEEVISIIKTVKKYVSPGNSVYIEVKKNNGENYKSLFYILKDKKGNDILVLHTNRDTEKGIFLKEINLENKGYVRWYHLNGDKMTYRKDISETNDYSSVSKYELARLYLFDELPDNDDQIEKTVNEYLKTNPDVPEKIKAHILLLDYYIFKRDNQKIKEKIKFLKELFDIYNNEYNLDLLYLFFSKSLNQIELMEALKSDHETR
jgi:hypothetical protein